MMDLHDLQIKAINDLLKDIDFKSIPIKESAWPDVGKNNFILSKESAYELGYQQGLMINLVTSSDIGEDGIYLYGQDLSDLKEADSYLRIALVKISNEELEGEKLFEQIKQIGYSRYRVNPEGFMLKVTGVGDIEKVRLSKEAIRKGISFADVGNLYLKAYQKLPYVEKVRMYFLTADIDFKAFEEISLRTGEITKAIDHITKTVLDDCGSCSVKTICDSVQSMRLLHKKEDKQGFSSE